MLTQVDRIRAVLERLIGLVEDDRIDVEVLSDDLDVFLNEIHDCDGFGTEGQSDPRGDYRDSEHWNMWHVQGLDE